MKQKLLSLVALAGAMFMSASAWAQWTEPAAPTLEETNASAIESGKSYFIKNVGAGQFITGSNSWSTQISLTMEGVADTYSPALVIMVEDSTQTFGTAQVSGYALRLNGTFTVNGASNERTFTNTYLFRDSEESGFMDHGTQAKGYIWKITKADNGYFRIQTAEGDPSFPDAATQYAGWVTEEGMTIADGASTVVTFNLEETAENIDWMFIDATNYLVQKAAYEPRKELYDLLVSTTEEGYDVDTDAATKVYNDASATVEEIKAAIEKLKAAINRAKFETLLAGATDDDPIDATEYVLVNPDFEVGNIEGWTTNYVSGQQANNIGYQGASYTNGDVTISKFIEAWKSNGSPFVIGDGYLQQTVYGLPSGKYVLEADAISVYQWSDAAGKNPAEGVSIFIQAGQYEAKTAIATGDGKPEHFSVSFVNPRGSDVLTFGLKTESATANWIAADNFKIYYYGETDLTPAQVELERAIKEAENIDTNVPANVNDLEALEKGIEDATAVLNSNPDDETALAARDAMKAATDAFNASAKAYQEFEVYFGTGGEFEGLLEQVLENEGWAELADAMDKYNTELQTKFISNTLTTEEINESQDHVQQLILDFIQGDKVKAGDNLTLLLKNPGFDNGLNGWTVDVKEGDARGAWTVFDGVDYHEVESWHVNFDLYQVIPNMPAGVYTISVQGFARLDDGLTETTIELYAGNSTASFPSISRLNGSGPDEYSEEILYDAASFGDTPIDMDGQTVYVPNGMAGAQVYFGMDNPLTGKPFYQREVKITLREAGDLRIGVRSNSTHEWVLWDNMKITYAGDGLELYYQMIEEAQEKMMAAVNAENAFVTKAATTKVNDLNGRVDKMDELETSDQALALIADIEAATKYIQAGVAKGNALQDAIDLYNELSGAFSTADSALPALLSNAQQQKDDPATIESNEAVDDIIASFKKAWGTYVTFDAADEPTEKYDATYAIFNYNYFHPVKAENSSEGWTVENIGGAYAADWKELEAFNNDTIYIHQTIEGLKPGFYEVDLQGYYRAGLSSAYNGEQGDSLKQIQHAYIYATTSLGEMTTPLRNAIDQSEIQEMNLGAGSETAVKNLEGTEMYIPENMEAAATYFENGFYPNSLKVQVGEDGVLELAIRKWSHIDGDWTIFTNWQLFYLGKTGQNFSDELTAVQGVESTNAKAAQIFTLDGRQAARLNRGINIVRMSDGSVHKVMVK